MFKVDLHTHSTASPDGGISIDHYQKAIDEKLLDVVAITDHNQIEFALKIKKLLGDHAIVGEEIMTTEGEIIGLFLSQIIPPGLSPQETVQQIKAQKGLVYIPHPFETIRHGLHPEIIESLVEQIDIIEIYNGRAFAQDRSSQAVVFAKLNQLIGVASSDAHGYLGLGKTYTGVSHMPDNVNLLELLSSGTPIVSNPGLRELLYPKFHRLRKRIKKDR
ncbi:MAG TPA: PHP domain-containing protein [Candidatus Saccharimonadales bacterium]|nr:PHP domain-containing protein [Candidatus Saccharimonadales bacterium]